MLECPPRTMTSFTDYAGSSVTIWSTGPLPKNHLSVTSLCLTALAAYSQLELYCKHNIMSGVYLELNWQLAREWKWKLSLVRIWIPSSMSRHHPTLHLGLEQMSCSLHFQLQQFFSHCIAKTERPGMVITALFINWPWATSVEASSSILHQCVGIMHEFW